MKYIYVYILLKSYVSSCVGLKGRVEEMFLIKYKRCGKSEEEGKHGSQLLLGKLCYSRTAAPLLNWNFTLVCVCLAWWRPGRQLAVLLSPPTNTTMFVLRPSLLLTPILSFLYCYPLQLVMFLTIFNILSATN